MMSILRGKIRAGAIAWLAVILTFSSLRGAPAEEPIPSEVDVSDVPGYVAIWKLGIDIMGNTIELFLNIADVKGKIGATLDSPRQPEPLAISEIVKTEEGLEMNSELTFGGSFKIDINLNLKLEGDKLVGTIKDKGGFFNSAVSGEKVGQEELDAVQGRRPPPTEARLTIDGKKIRIAFASLDMERGDWEKFQAVQEGEIYQFATSRATKIYTDLDLDFGNGVVIKQGNVAENYPGVYSVWMRRVGDGWHWVFNSQPDIWGTRYLAEHDAAEVPLTMEKVEGDPREKLFIELEEKGEGGGVARILWGDSLWTANFTISR